MALKQAVTHPASHALAFVLVPLASQCGASASVPRVALVKYKDGSITPHINLTQPDTEPALLACNTCTCNRVAEPLGAPPRVVHHPGGNNNSPTYCAGRPTPQPHPSAPTWRYQRHVHAQASPRALTCLTTQQLNTSTFAIRGLATTSCAAHHTSASASASQRQLGLHFWDALSGGRPSRGDIAAQCQAEAAAQDAHKCCTLQDLHQLLDRRQASPGGLPPEEALLALRLVPRLARAPLSPAEKLLLHSTMDGLVSVCIRNIHSLELADLSLALATCARVRHRPHDLLVPLQLRLQQEAAQGGAGDPQACAQELPSIATSLSRMHLVAPRLWQALAAAATLCIGRMQPQGLAELVAAHARLRLSHPALFDAACEALCQTLQSHSAEPEHVATLLWALARMGHKVPTHLMEPMLRFMAAAAPQLDGARVASVAAACAKLGAKDARLARALHGRALQVMQDAIDVMNEGGLPLLAYSPATAARTASGTLGCVSAPLAGPSPPSASDLSPQVLAVMVEGLAGLGCANPELGCATVDVFKFICKRARGGHLRLSPEDVALLAKGLARAGLEADSVRVLRLASGQARGG